MSKYLYALSNGKRIHISDALRGKHEYTCPICGTEMIAKKGTKRTHHFAHLGDYACDEWSANKSEWHLQMQGLFPKEAQEVVLEANGEKHIADVCLTKPCGQKLVIEFQASRMENEEFIRRTKFWKSNGADMIWVFNMINKDIREYPNQNGNIKEYIWKNPFSTLGENKIETVPIFFHIQPQDVTGSRAKYQRFVRLIKPLDPERYHNFTGVSTRKKAYSMFQAEICNTLLESIEERMTIEYTLPFVEYPSDIWVLFENEESFLSDEYMQDFIKRYDRKDVIYMLSDLTDLHRIRIYIREKRMTMKILAKGMSKAEFFKNLIQQYGESRVKLVERQ